MSRTERAKSVAGNAPRFLRSVLFLGFALGLAAACGGAESTTPPQFVPGGGAGGEGGSPDGGTCKGLSEGCLCEVPGETADCKVVEYFGSYTTCTVGVYTCSDDGLWGPCIGERTTTQ